MGQNDALSQAMALHQAGNLTGTEACYRQAVQQQPAQPHAWHGLGLLLAATERFREALPCLEQTVALQPGDPSFWNNLGQVYLKAGQPERAETSWQRALDLRPELPQVHFNLGNLFNARQQHDLALAAYRRALELQPRYAKAHFNLANTLREYGLVKDAVAAYQQALGLQPVWAEAYLNLAIAQNQLGQQEEALASFHKAQEQSSKDLDLDASLGNTYVDLGDTAQARDHYQREVARHPERWLRKLRLETLAEPIPADNAAIDRYQESVRQTLETFRAQAPLLDLEELATSGAEPPMALTYQGRDDRPLKELYAAVFAAGLPVPPEVALPAGPVHVGVVVTHGHEGVFLKCLGGLVERLPSPDLRITLVCDRAGANIFRQRLKNPKLNYLVLPGRVEQAAQTIREAGLHWLHYWEVGTDSLNYFLPFFRPACRQSTTWGWPSTTGIPHMDSFVSSSLLEPPQAQEHYTEPLILLPSLPTYYARPAPTQFHGRDHYSLPPGTLYLCVQNLRKYHPDFDALLAGIVQADPAGHVVLIGDQRPLLTQQLRRRLEKVLPEGQDRLVWLPRLGEADYLNVLRLADVALDTVHYGGGANTVFDALALGTPLVTWPGPYQRGRWALAAYQELGIVDCVATSWEDYVRRAVHLGTQKDYRQEVSRRLKEASAGLFEKQKAVEELRDFFLEGPVGR